MKYIRGAEEKDVAKAFLAAELNNPRHNDAYRVALGKSGIDVAQKLNDQDMLEIFKIARGWPNQLLFAGFPGNVSWELVEIDTNDLQRMRYINYSYWNELSQGSSRPARAANSVRAGVEVFGQSNTLFKDIADAVKAGSEFPPLVLGTLSDGNCVIIEGHARATGFTLAGRVPAGQRAILGKGDFDTWAKEGKD